MPMPFLGIVSRMSGGGGYDVGKRPLLMSSWVRRVESPRAPTIVFDSDDSNDSDDT